MPVNPVDLRRQFRLVRSVSSSGRVGFCERDGGMRGEVDCAAIAIGVYSITLSARVRFCRGGVWCWCRWLQLAAGMGPGWFRRRWCRYRNRSDARELWTVMRQLVATVCARIASRLVMEGKLPIMMRDNRLGFGL